MEKQKILVPCVEFKSLSNFGDLGKKIYNLVYSLNYSLDISVVFPYYKTIFDKIEIIPNKIHEIKIHNLLFKFYHYKKDNIDFYFISNEYFFDNREFIYDSENIVRFTLFSLCVFELIKILEFKASILLNDWHLGILPVILKINNYKNRFLLTIHNFEHQGISEPEILKTANISYKYFYSGELEFYGKVNFLKCGIDYSDKIIIKSNDFFEEIKIKNSSTKFIEDIIKKNESKIEYIPQSIDKEYSPEYNKMIYKNYSKNSIENKVYCKLKLQNDLNFQSHTEIPILIIPAFNLTKYEILLLNMIVEYLVIMEIQIIILSYNLSDFEQKIKNYSFSSNCSAVSLDPSDEEFHKVFSGADMILDISFDFSNKNILKKALRYGVIPITFRESSELETENIHFKIFDFTRINLINTIKYTINRYYYLEKWNERIVKAIGLDFSLEKESNQYLKIIENG